MMGAWFKLEGVFHERRMSVSVMASTMGLSGQAEMSPKTTRTLAVTCKEIVYCEIFRIIELKYFSIICKRCVNCYVTCNFYLLHTHTYTHIHIYTRIHIHIIVLVNYLIYVIE